MTVSYMDYEGKPARLIEEDNRLRAELYVRGDGFVAIPVADVLFHGYAISAKEFEQMVLNLRQRR